MTNQELATRQEQAYVKKESYGTISFANEVIATIAGIAASDIPGVAGMSGGFIDGFVELLGRKNLSKGIKVTLGDGEASIEAAIVVQYGEPIPAIAQTIQERVRTAIESMAGLRVTAVNVHVRALSLQKQKSENDESVQIPALAYA